MQSQNKLRNCLINITPCVQQMCSYSIRRNLLAKPNVSAQKYESEIAEKKAVETTARCGHGPLAGDRLPTAVSLVSRSVSVSARNEVKSAFIRYGKSMTDLARSAQKLYKSARLRNAPVQQPMLGKINVAGARPLRVPEPSAFAITERLTKLFFRDPWDNPSEK
ncbi:uncharacterized protein LOC6526105 [Drosophila yakuba]|uniref:Uncharacterized protein n=1 Tax=Drosophila yakuba TaxID=7245 RepID=B4PYI9_DROYA|nr:uncharacterized protein LOC6526105 [Drosophila yakuba]XP_039233218.1 uncharacterized protein LOC6526105 [Drosophila yakuba]EDX03030.1 uncharacterized protein Dyak_GE17893 [Drosophila yakuba]